MGESQKIFRQAKEASDETVAAGEAKAMALLARAQEAAGRGVAAAQVLVAPSPSLSTPSPSPLSLTSLPHLSPRVAAAQAQAERMVQAASNEAEKVAVSCGSMVQPPTHLRLFKPHHSPVC